MTYTQLARYVQGWPYIKGTWQNPLGNSPLPGKSLPCSWSPLTYLESLLCVWCDSRPPWSQVACVLTSPPFSSPSPFPFPQRFPVSNTCPSTTTSQNRLHIVRYTRDARVLSEKLGPQRDTQKTHGALRLSGRMQLWSRHQSSSATRWLIFPLQCGIL